MLNRAQNSGNIDNSLSVRFQDTTTEWSSPPLWIKITGVALFTLIGFTLFAIALIGALALLGAHIGALSSLNSAITSIWKDLPYLTSAMGAPAIIIALGLMIYIAYTAISAIREHKKEQENPRNRDIHPSRPQFSRKNIIPSIKFPQRGSQAGCTGITNLKK